MKLLFKQKMFSWFDSYDIYDESGNTVYTVKGEISWGHKLKIYDKNGIEIGCVKEKVFSWLPRFEIFQNDICIGSIKKEFSLKPRFNIDFKGWQVVGNWFEWDYFIQDCSGQSVARITKEFFKWTDTYILDICHPQDAVYVLMLVIAIDAEKCSRKD